ncbi:MAG: sensor histidine kinase, partial [Bacillota bacterium]
MRLAPRMALQYAAGLLLLGILLLSAVPAVAQRVVAGSVGPVLLRQARGLAALLDGQGGGPRPPGARLAELAAVRLSRLYVDGEVLVVDGTGLVRWNSGTLMEDLRGWRVGPGLRGTAGAHYGLYEVLQGIPAVVAVAPLAPREGMDPAGAVVIFRPLRELGEVRRSIAAWLIGGTALALAGALVAGWTVGYGLVRRLRLIQQVAGELAEGNLSRRVPAVGSDEVADLAAHFNYMAGRLEALVAELRRAEGLRRSMLAVVSHELRTPVAVIRGLAEAMGDGLVEGDGDVRQHAGRIVAEAERLGRLIQDLFDVARIEAGQLDVRLRHLDAGPWPAGNLPRPGALARQKRAPFQGPPVRGAGGGGGGATYPRR